MITVSTDDHVVLTKPVFWNRSWKDSLRVKVKVVFSHRWGNKLLAPVDNTSLPVQPRFANVLYSINWQSGWCLWMQRKTKVDLVPQQECPNHSDQ